MEKWGKIKAKMLYHTKWINAGIVYLHDIAMENRFINITESSRQIKCPTNLF